MTSCVCPLNVTVVVIHLDRADNKQQETASISTGYTLICSQLKAVN